MRLPYTPHLWAHYPVRNPVDAALIKFVNEFDTDLYLHARLSTQYTRVFTAVNRGETP